MLDEALAHNEGRLGEVALGAQDELVNEEVEQAATQGPPECSTAPLPPQKRGAKSLTAEGRQSGARRLRSPFQTARHKGAGYRA